MPDVLIQNEPEAALREIQIMIYTPAGVPATGISEVTADIVISKPGGNFVASTATLTEITGGAVGGKYRLRFPADEVDTIGDLQFEIVQASDIESVNGYVTVRLFVFDEIAEDGHTYGDLERGQIGALVGPSSGYLVGPIVIKALNGVKTRWTVTTDATGRLSLTPGDLTP